MTGQEIVGHVGAVLLDSLWQGALVGLEAACALIGTRRARPGIRYAIACTALLLCLLWPALELAARLHGGAPDGGTAVLVRLLPGAGAGGAGDWQGFLQAHLAWVVAGWAACAGALGLRLALGLAWVRRSAHAGRADPAWHARLTRMAQDFGIRRAVGLRVVDTLASPVTAGWWRPVVLVPASLASGMPPQLLEALLAHELAHVRRCDYLVNLAQNLIETILFYHPVVWWLSHRIRVEREHIADDIAARQLGEPRRLAQALSELERLQFSPHRLAQAADGGDLLARIRRLVRPDMPASGWQAALPALVLVLALSVAGLAGFAQTAIAARLPAVPAPALAATRAIADFSSCAKPDYPAGALAAGAVGTVTLGYLIGTDGRVHDSAVRRSSGHPALDEAARAAIARCSFAPATRGGKPVAQWEMVQYVWSLG